ncbi:MAG: CDP-glycerol glycerophosphotransferase family protein [Candidatus Hodarchaeota archaeon]
MNWKILDNILKRIKIIKIAKVLRINPHFFFDLVIFHFSKIFKANVNDNLIVLGAANGKAFIGNPKYLYIFLKNNTNYKLLWFSRSKELIRKLKQMGINCIFTYSLDAIRTLRKARAVFVSHGWGDILPIKFPPRTVVVQTWHGGFIKIKGKHPYVTKYINSKWTTLTRLKIRYYQFFDYVISASSDINQLNIASNVFNFPVERIITTGYPRNDILFSTDSNVKKRLKSNYNIPDNIKRIILYAPTYREVISKKKPFERGDIINLNRLCKDTDSIFLIKAHINEDLVSFTDFEYARLVSKNADIQELLLISDILITDYSSVICDFLLLNRPILLYTYDYDEYINHRGIYYKNLEEIAPGPLLFSPKELIDAIKNIEDIYKNYKSKAAQIRDYFNKYKDGNSSKRLLKFLKLIH